MPQQQSISRKDAVKIILQRQGLNNRQTFGKGQNGTLRAIQHLGYIQLDTLSVVSRAHIHTLWNRVEGFEPKHIDALQAECAIFEYWSHALSILPIEDYRYCLPMMARIANGEIHWYPKETKETKKVLKRIREEGPLSAKDFTDKKSSKKMWGRSASKQALEQLFMEGELMIPRRNNFHKVYDLRERVLPDSVDTSMPSRDEHCRHLIERFLRAQGLGQVKETAYLRKGMGADIKRIAQEMIEEGSIVSLEIAGQDYLGDPDALEILEQASARSSFRILSPFDNLVIQRTRTQQLFDFDYQIECYVPKSKRRFGYFCLPLLHKNRLVGRLDAKADRKAGVFHLLHLQIEDHIRSSAPVFKALLPELKKFASSNQCESFRLHHYSGCGKPPPWANQSF